MKKITRITIVSLIAVVGLSMCFIHVSVAEWGCDRFLAGAPVTCYGNCENYTGNYDNCCVAGPWIYCDDSVTTDPKHYITGGDCGTWHCYMSTDANCIGGSKGDQAAGSDSFYIDCLASD
jgi:hypothetical protein